MTEIASKDRVFGAVFAGNYDAVYAAKDTASEVALVQRLWREHEDGGSPATMRVLDVGCGTGRHAIPFALAGHHVVGVDRSPQMLEQARAKAAEASASLRLVLGDAGTVDVGESFDVVTLLFTVLGYMRTDDDVDSVLQNVARHMRTGGLLVFDVWSTSAVLRDPPQPREQTYAVPGGRVVRRSSGSVDSRTDSCRVDIEIERYEGGALVQRERESHEMRFFAPSDLTRFLDRAGFELVQMGAAPDLEREPSSGDWTLWVVARKRP